MSFYESNTIALQFMTLLEKPFTTNQKFNFVLHPLVREYAICDKLKDAKWLIKNCLSF